MQTERRALDVFKTPSRVFLSIHVIFTCLPLTLLTTLNPRDGEAGGGARARTGIPDPLCYWTWTDTACGREQGSSIDLSWGRQATRHELHIRAALMRSNWEWWRESGWKRQTESERLIERDRERSKKGYLILWTFTTICSSNIVPDTFIPIKLSRFELNREKEDKK